MNQKNENVLILEDLGITREEFVKMASRSKLPYNFLWNGDENKVNKEHISGLITIKNKIDRQILDVYPEIKFIAVAFTGFDNIDLRECKKRNIAVYNVPAYSTESVAELTVGLAISLLREIPAADRLVHEKKWDLGHAGNELCGKTIGILGTGAIGNRAAELFRAFKCEIIGWSRTARREFRNLEGQYVASSKELFSSSDIVSVHLPLNDETRRYVDKKLLDAMNPNAYLINTSRGGVVDKDALVETLINKKISGAAIDVFDQEPLPSDDPLLSLTNIILTPHIAYKTKEALIRRVKGALANIRNFAKGKDINRVDK